MFSTFDNSRRNLNDKTTLARGKYGELYQIQKGHFSLKFGFNQEALTAF